MVAVDADAVGAPLDAVEGAAGDDLGAHPALVADEGLGLIGDDDQLDRAVREGDADELGVAMPEISGRLFAHCGAAPCATAGCGAGMCGTPTPATPATRNCSMSRTSSIERTPVCR